MKSRFNYLKSLSLIFLLGCECNSKSNIILPMKPFFTNSVLNKGTTLDPNLYGKYNHFEYYGLKNYCKNDSFLIDKINKVAYQKPKEEMEIYYSYIYYFFETKNGEHPNKKFYFDSINKLVSSESLRAVVIFREGKLYYFQLAEDGEFYYDVKNKKGIRELVE
jgi:hypothetical protein